MYKIEDIPVEKVVQKRPKNPPLRDSMLRAYSSQSSNFLALFENNKEMIEKNKDIRMSNLVEMFMGVNTLMLLVSTKPYSAKLFEENTRLNMSKILTLSVWIIRYSLETIGMVVSCTTLKED